MTLPRPSSPQLLPLSLALAVASACGAPEPPHNVLLVVVDTLRADHTSLLGYPRETTPELDAFAAEGRVFENARASSSWTKPSMATLLTGLSVAEHGIETDEARLSETATTLAEVLWSNGYATALFSDNPYVSRAFGFAQGYQRIVDYAGDDHSQGRLREHAARDWEQRSGAPALNQQLLSWLDSTPSDRPWFAHIHYMEPHWPYRPPPAFYAKFAAASAQPVALANLWDLETGIASALPGDRLSDDQRRALIDAYDGAVAFWDDRFGALLDELDERDQLSDTVIAVVSDHGEGFYEHATWAHQNSLYDELVRVPLVVRGPGIEAGREAAARTVRDLPSTLVGLAGLPMDEVGTGRSLLSDEASEWSARLERYGRRYHATLQQGHKWIVSQGEDLDRVEAFAVADDPAEQNDLSAASAEASAALRRRMLERAAAERAGGLQPERAEIGQDMREALRALGYAD